MKKLLTFFICIIQTAICLCQVKTRSEVIRIDNNEVIVKNTYVVTETETYVKQNQYNRQTNGNIGIVLRGGYNFPNKHKQCGCIDFGVSLFYNFGGSTNGKFGVSAGFDHSVSYQNLRDKKYNKDHWHGRAGIVLGKYFGIGSVFGNCSNCDSRKISDGGVYVTIYMPFCNYFGMHLDGKWTSHSYFTAGAGFIFMIPINN